MLHSTAGCTPQRGFERGPHQAQHRSTRSPQHPARGVAGRRHPRPPPRAGGGRQQVRPCTRGSLPDLSGSRRRSSPPAARPPRSWPPQAAGCPAGRAARLGREAPTTTDPSLRRRRGEGPRPARSPVGAPAGAGRSGSDSRPDLWGSWRRPVSLGRAVAFGQLGPAPSPAGARASARAHVWGSPLLRRCRCPHLQLWRLLRGGGGTRAEHRLLRSGPGKRVTSTASTAAVTRQRGPSPQCSAPSRTDCCEDAAA